MPSIKALASQIAKEFPAFSFEDSDDFSWDPTTSIIYYDSSDSQASQRLLHELAHGVLNHQSYERDIDLVALERDAWQYTKLTLGPNYDVTVSPDTIHDDMETYRDWMHIRSLCPKCESNGIETKKLQYTCVNCLHNWRVNDARLCALRRIAA